MAGVTFIDEGQRVSDDDAEADEARGIVVAPDDVEKEQADVEKEQDTELTDPGRDRAEAQLRWEVSPMLTDVGNKYTQMLHAHTPGYNVFPLDEREGARMEDNGTINMRLADGAVLLCVADGHGSADMTRARAVGGYETAYMANACVNYWLEQRLRAGDGHDAVCAALGDAFAFAQACILEEMARGAVRAEAFRADDPERTAELARGRLDGHHFRDLETGRLRDRFLNEAAEYTRGGAAKVVAGKLLVELPLRPRRTQRPGPPGAEPMGPAARAERALVPVYCNRAGKRLSDVDYGATCTACLLLPSGRLYVAHVGDSDAYVLRRGGGGWAAIKMTKAHTVHNADEVRRLEAHGMVARDRYFTLDLEAGGRKALMPSRSFGHAHLCHFGVSAVPSLSHLDLRPGDVLLLASDGLWDLDVLDARHPLYVGARPTESLGLRVALNLLNRDSTLSASALASAILRAVQTTCGRRDNLALVAVRAS